MLEAQDIAWRWRPDRPVLEAVSAAVRSGSFLAILGVNGCGKSTLIACLNDMIRPQRGTVLLDGQALAALSRAQRARRIALVTQRNPTWRLSVYDAVLLGRKPYLQGAPSQEDYLAVDEVLNALDIADFALRYLDELSGGEYQKVVLARALVQQTEVLLLDEPTNNLDPASQQEVMQRVRQAVDQRALAAAVILHDINLALAYCDRFLLLRAGRVLTEGGAEVITAAMVSRLYGLEADIVEHCGRKVVIPRLRGQCDGR